METIIKEINEVYKKSGFINTGFKWEFKILELLQDNSKEAYIIYNSLENSQKHKVLTALFELDNDMGSDGDGEIETTKQNLRIMLAGSKQGKIY